MTTKVSNIIAKARDGYACVRCGSLEMVQAHHRVPGDDSTMITLCADCHSKEHPNMPRAFFFVKNHQPCWHNRPAAALAREWGVHSRTVTRAAKALSIPMGELSTQHEELMRSYVCKNWPVAVYQTKILEMKHQGFSLLEISQGLGTSRQRIAQIYRKAKGTQQSRRRKP